MENPNKKRSSLPRYTVPARRANQVLKEIVENQQRTDNKRSIPSKEGLHVNQQSPAAEEKSMEKIMSIVDRFLVSQSSKEDEEFLSKLIDRRLSVNEATTAFLLAAPHVDASLEKHDFPLSCEVAEILGKKKIWSKRVQELYAEKHGKELMEDWTDTLDPSVVKVHNLKPGLTFLKTRTSFAIPESDGNVDPKFPLPPWIVTVMKVVGGQALLALEDEVFLRRMSLFLRSAYRTLGGVDKFRPDLKKLLLMKEKAVVIVLVGRHEYARAILINHQELVDEAGVYLMDLGHTACIKKSNIFLPPPSYRKLNPLSFWVNLWQLDGSDCEDPIYQAAIREILGKEKKFWAVPVEERTVDPTIRNVVGSWGGMPVALLKTTKNEDGTINEDCLNLQIKDLVERVHSIVRLVQVGQVVNGATITKISDKNDVFIVFNTEEFRLLESALFELARRFEGSISPVKEVEPMTVYLVNETIRVPGVLEECRAFRAVKSDADGKVDSPAKITMVAVDCGLTVEVDLKNVFELKKVAPLLACIPVKGCHCKLDLPSWKAAHYASAMLIEALNPIRKEWTGRHATIVVISPDEVMPRVVIMEHVKGHPKENEAKLACLNLLLEEALVATSSS